MKYLTNPFLGLLGVLLVITAPASHAARLSTPLPTSAVHYFVSAQVQVSGDDYIEADGYWEEIHESSEQPDAELKAEQMRRFYLKLILLKSAGH